MVLILFMVNIYQQTQKAVDPHLPWWLEIMARVMTGQQSCMIMYHGQ